MDKDFDTESIGSNNLESPFVFDPGDTVVIGLLVASVDAGEARVVPMGPLLQDVFNMWHADVLRDILGDITALYNRAVEEKG